MHPAWRVIGVLAATLFFGMAAAGVARGKFDDPETGVVQRQLNPRSSG
jgi:hypothetical protein